jgi:tRNA threonylcarbamoyladenosine biosynthesis protein TsaE
LRESELVRWGEEIGRSVERPCFLALRGELGAGKSVLARAVARGAGVTSSMPSPTFNLIFRYNVQGGSVAHLDLFRLNRPDEVWELGWAELGRGNEIVLVEWPERAESLLPADRWDILLEHTNDEVVRRVTASAAGSVPRLPPIHGR